LENRSYLGHADVLSITERRHRQVQLALLVPLPEELLASPVGPQPRDLPRATWVGDVGTLQSDLRLKSGVYASHLAAHNVIIDLKSH